MALPIEPLSGRGGVAHQVYHLLRDRIVTCDLPPGVRISETEVAATYEVSRQPVREAFIKLSDEQLVLVRPQRGTFVRRISIAAALTARFIREAVEADLVRRAVGRADAETLDALDAQIAQQRGATNSADFMQLDETFHRTLAQAGGEAAVSDYLESLNVQMNRVRHISARQFAPDRLIGQHIAIVDAIRTGDAAVAEAAMRDHLHEIKHDLPRIVETHPDYFEDIEALT